LIGWLLAGLCWRLPKLVLRLLAWLLRRLAGLCRRSAAAPETGDSFYRSYRWRRLRIDALEANRMRYGMLACECCGMIDARQWHVDHIYPRSTHPELALEPDNLQVLCDACNVGKATAYTTNWRGGADPLERRSWWQRLGGG
jgi:5-methylcytosine-specific restriction endonuclease McrA